MFRRILISSCLGEIKITPHALRHTTAYFNLIHGGTLESTRQLLRHQDIKTTQIYQDYIDQLNDMSSIHLDQFILKEELIDDFL